MWCGGYFEPFTETEGGDNGFGGTDTRASEASEFISVHHKH